MALGHIAFGSVTRLKKIKKNQKNIYKNIYQKIPRIVVYFCIFLDIFGYFFEFAGFFSAWLPNRKKYQNISKNIQIYGPVRLGARRLAAAWYFVYILYILYIFVYIWIYFGIFFGLVTMPKKFKKISKYIQISTKI